MKVIFATIFPLFLLFFSCRRNIEYENIQNNDGVYFDNSTGKILDGKYKSVDYNSSSRETVFTSEFNEGVQVGEWEEWYSDELIHRGKYVQEDELAIKIKDLTKCKRINFNLWKEVDFAMLSIELIQPTYADTNTLEKIAELTKNELNIKYDFKSIIFDSISNSTLHRRIFEYEIK